MAIQIVLRDPIPADLPIFFEQHLDEAANFMAAFTTRDPTDRDAFMAHWARIMADDTNTIKTILASGAVAGSVSSYQESGRTEVTYWLGKEYWGQGIATEALRDFLGVIDTRPLHARAAKDNAASLRVLAKCGFRIIGQDIGFANARGVEVEEYLLLLSAGDEMSAG